MPSVSASCLQLVICFAYQNSDRAVRYETALSGETGTIGGTFEFDDRKHARMHAASKFNRETHLLLAVFLEFEIVILIMLLFFNKIERFYLIYIFIHSQI